MVMICYLENTILCTKYLSNVESFAITRSDLSIRNQFYVQRIIALSKVSTIMILIMVYKLSYMISINQNNIISSANWHLDDSDQPPPNQLKGFPTIQFFLGGSLEVSWIASGTARSNDSGRISCSASGMILSSVAWDLRPWEPVSWTELGRLSSTPFGAFS